MNSRVKTQFGLVVLRVIFLCLFMSEMTQADEVPWDSLKSDKIQIQPFSTAQGEVLTSYPAILQVLITQVLKWDPKKEPNNSSNSFGLLKNLSVDFDLSDTKHFRKAWFQLNSNLKVRGLFGIHDFKKPRPLIILRMGIHGNVDEMFAERFIAKAVYDDLDANILILESLTSHAFISQNSKAALGGVEEGLHTFFILNEITKNEFHLKPIISSLHLIGVSLGGQGTFVTALLDQSNEKKINSILNFCPLINLQKTFEHHSEPGLQAAAVDFWNQHRMNYLYKNYQSQLSDLEMWKVIFDWQPRFTPRILKIFDQERKTSLLTAKDIEKQIFKMKWPTGFFELITQSKTFFEMNNFWSLYQGVKTPMMIYTTPNDPLVTNELNSELIFSGQQAGDFKQLKYKRLEKGVHCGFAPVYPWPELILMFKEGLGLK